MRMLISLAVFVGSLAATTVACAWGWEALIKNHIYNCTDDLPLDYLQPGQWVHHPVTVPQVVAGRSMSEPDVILQGWSVLSLWEMWLSLVAGSVLVSFFACAIVMEQGTTDGVDS